MPSAFRCTAILGVCAVALTATISGQTSGRALSVDAIYDPDSRVDFSGTPPANLRWIDDATYLQSRRTGGGVEWLKVDAVSGRTTPLFDASRMESALARLPGLNSTRASSLARSNDLLLNPARTGALVEIDEDLYFYRFGTDDVTRLTNAPGTEEEAEFSPDGNSVAFVRGNNLHVVDTAGQKELALTTDGGPQILNGKLDWLYQEEIYGRGRFRGYWWSPDSAHLAFLQLDERPVPEYTVVDDIPYRPTVEVTDYPKAGDANPLVRLGIARAAGGGIVWVEQGNYVPADMLVVDVDWAPGTLGLTYQVQNREQTWLDLNLADSRSGRSRRLLRETTPAWVNVNGSPTWLANNSFLWFSERTGFKHVYLYSHDGELIRPVTSGRWDVRTFYGLDEQRGHVYFGAGARRHIDSDIYRIRLDGTDLTRLSRTDGTHRANFSPSFTLYVDTWSDVVTPPQVRLHRSDGSDVRVIDANRVAALAEYNLSTPEFVEVRTRDGFVMDGMLIRPPDFNPSTRYPVYQLTYAGPGTALVRNQWGYSQYIFHQLLAQQGIVVWVLDNRSSGGKGAESQWPVYGRLGELELQDLEDGITWLKQQPYIDSSRIALSGWSYGGFMTAYALTHSTSWSAGIVGAPVTDWRNYDTVYTERYMKTPANNPSGYRSTAPRFAAANLSGRMLLIHGGIDDNVHRQNSEQFVYELQRAGKTFELMIYPRQRHGFSDARLNKHLRQMMFDFTMSALRVNAPVSGPGAQ